MKDIVEIGTDLVLVDSVVSKAGNVIAVQLGDLEYAKNFGVDKKYFLESEIQFQNESFKAYLVQRITEHQINVAGAEEDFKPLFEKIEFSVGDLGQNGEGLIL